MKKRLEDAIGFVEQASKIVQSFYLKGFEVEFKENNTFVTQADREAELLLRKLITDAYPTDSIVGEEFPDMNTTGEYTWTIDPIDGTSSFVHHVPLYGCMLGLLHNNIPVLGVVYFPATDELIYATKGQGAHFKRAGGDLKQAHVRNPKDLSDAWFSHSGNEYFEKTNLENSLELIRQNFGVERGWGDCYGYYLLATGKIDLMMDACLGLWDIVPIKLICEEAGADWFGFDGERSLEQQGAIACSPKLTPKIVEILKLKLK